MPTDRTIDKNLDTGRLGSVPLAGTPQAVVAAKNQRHITLFYFGGEAAGTAVNLPLYVADRAITVISLTIAPAAALTANATNYASGQLQYTNGAGGAATNIANAITTAAVSWVALTNLAAATLLAAAAGIPSGNTIQFVWSKVGTGVALVGHTIDMVIEEV